MPRPNRAEDIVRLLAEQGGAGVRAELAGAVSASALRSAESRGWVTHLGNGSVVLARLAVPPLGNLDVCRSWTKPDLEPSAAEAEHITSLLAFARGSRGILSHRSAAIAHRWAILEAPKQVELVFRRGRRGPADTAVPIKTRHADLTDEELRQHCTSPLRTVISCARDLHPTEALAIADSALRAGDVGELELRAAGESYAGPRAAQVRRVLANADGAAANPFESALRWILLDVLGVEFSPQVRVEQSHIGLLAIVDLGVEELRLACEADSYEFHGGRDNFHKDRRRYALLNAVDWMVLTFTLRQVREEPEWIRAIVETVVALRRAHIAMERDAASWRRLQRKRARVSKRARRTEGPGPSRAA